MKNIFKFDPKLSQVVIVENIGSIQKTIKEAFILLGCQNISCFLSYDELNEELISSENLWIIGSLQLESEYSLLRFLDSNLKKKSPHPIYITALVENSEKKELLDAYSLGLFSHFQKNYNIDAIQKNFKSFIETLSKYNFNPVLTSAEYLRAVLSAEKKYPELLLLEEELVRLFPSEYSVVLNLSRALYACESFEDAVVIAKQAALIKPDMQETISQLIKSYSLLSSNSKTISSIKSIFGFTDAVVIDPDSAVLGAIKKALSEAGVQNINTFEDGSEAWSWLLEHPETQLVITEWRIPPLSGNILIQRLRSLENSKTHFLIISSLLKDNDLPLLRELGILGLIQKPFELKDIYQTLSVISQQLIHPTESKHVELKIQTLFAFGKVEEAGALVDEALKNSKIDKKTKTSLEAELFYFRGDFSKALDIAQKAILEGADSLRLYDVIGKCYFKKKNYEVASKFFLKCQKLSPKNIEHLCNLAASQIESKDFENAETTIASAKSFDNQNPKVLEMESKINLLKGDIKRSSELLNALPNLSKVIGFMNNKAISSIKQGLYDEGIQLYLQTLEALKTTDEYFHEVVLLNLAIGYARTGKYTEALNTIASHQFKFQSEKSAKMLKTIQYAVVTGEQMTFSKTDDLVETEVKPAMEMEYLANINKGDFCCYLIFCPSKN